MTKISLPNEAIELYDQLIADHPNIERKGKTTPYTSINGHMFSFLSKDGVMGLRLSENDRNQFLEAYNTELMVQHGRTMKEYVKVPQSLLLDIKIMSGFLEKSIQYVMTLKPKATKKR